MRSLAVESCTHHPAERATQLRAFAFIRRRHMTVLKIMADLLRGSIASRGLIVGNIHALPQVDFELMRDVFDHPGVAVRPGYIKNPVLRKPYVGYAVRLYGDLCKRDPLVSVRANFTAA